MNDGIKSELDIANDCFDINDYAEAFYYYRKLAEQGNAYAEYKLGYMFEKALGCNLDYNKAAYWYKKAVDQGNAEACYRLVEITYKGNLDSIYKNIDTFDLLMKAANAGVVDAMIGLGCRYKELLDESYDNIDYIKALYWYKKAAASLSDGGLSEFKSKGEIDNEIKHLIDYKYSKIKENFEVKFSSDEIENFYKRYNEYIRFGSYPQSEVGEKQLIEELTKLVGNKPNINNPNGFLKHFSKEEINSRCNFWYKDITYENRKYRCVYFPDSCQDKTSNPLYYCGEYYFFEFSSITWKLIKEENNKGILLSDKILDLNYFDDCSNNYANSKIRCYLNNEFYNTAFNESQKKLINIVEIDNENYPKTKDKVWLLSKNEALYTFCDNVFRCLKKCSYYACYQNTINQNVSRYLNIDLYSKKAWWLRSPYDGNSKFVSFVVDEISEAGVKLNDHNFSCYGFGFIISDNKIGVVPAICINLRDEDKIKNERELFIKNEIKKQKEIDEKLLSDYDKNVNNYTKQNSYVDNVKNNYEQDSVNNLNIADKYYSNDDYKKALEYYNKVDSKYYEIKHYCYIGYCYDSLKDYDNAIKYYKIVSNTNDDSYSKIAEYNIGLIYYYDNGYLTNIDEAYKWFKLSSNKGYNNAKEKLEEIEAKKEAQDAINNLNIADKYYSNDDYKKALEYYNKVDEKYYKTKDYCFIGYSYYKLSNYDDALDYFKIVSDADDNEYSMYAEYYISSIYRNGLGVTKDNKIVIDYLKKSANRGYVFAEYNLGICYYYGECVEKDYAIAFNCFLKSAKQGDSNGQCMVGLMYSNGQGITKNISETIYWYNKAIEQDNMYAIYNKGLLYEYGEGVIESLDTAISLYKRSAKKGFQKAIDKLKKLGIE